MKIRYISDTHFGHKNCLTYDNRPWKDIETADSEMIHLWNEHVGDDDIVYHLGDFVWGGYKDWERILKQLNGQIYIVKGNHDKVSTIENICCGNPRVIYAGEQVTIDDGDKKVVLNHCPIITYPNAHAGWYHLYGHVHSGMVYNATLYQQRTMEDLFLKKFHMYNVGAMMLNYYPRTLDEIIKIYEQKVQETDD